MRTVTVAIFALCAIATAAPANEILLEEGFEVGFDGSGWVWTDDVGDGAWYQDSALSRSGAGALRIEGRTSNTYLSWEFPTGVGDVVAEAWFYDDMGETFETFVSVSNDPNYRNLTNGHLKVGGTWNDSADFYLVAEGYEVFVSSLGRTHGWHQVRIVSTGGVNHCYIDGTLLHSTSFQYDWRYLILNEDSHYQQAQSSWFDDVRVYREQPVSQGARSFGAVKALCMERR